jgi:hypothetical protein
VFYVAATLAAQRLVIGVSEDWGFGVRLTNIKKEPPKANGILRRGRLEVNMASIFGD